MKTRILTTTLTLFTAAAFAADPAAPPVKTNSGKATITIDVNGKKETREIEVGDGVEIKAGTPAKLDIPTSSITYLKTMLHSVWLGVAAEEVSEELRAQLPLEPGSGLIVRSVIPESPAAAASLQKNDVLMKLDDQLLTNSQQLRTLVSTKKDGDLVRLTYFRRGQLATAEVKLATHEETVGPGGVSVLSELPIIGPLFQMHSKSVVVKDGKVVGGDDQAEDLSATVAKIEKSLRDAGLDNEIIAKTNQILAETTKTIRDALREAGAAKQEIQQGVAEVAKALEQARAAMDRARDLAAKDAMQKEMDLTRARADMEKLAAEEAAKKEKARKAAPVPLEKNF